MGGNVYNLGGRTVLIVSRAKQVASTHEDKTSTGRLSTPTTIRRSRINEPGVGGKFRQHPRRKRPMQVNAQLSYFATHEMVMSRNPEGPFR